MPMPFPIKQGHATNLKPKGRRSKRGGASSRQTLLKRKKGNGKARSLSKTIGCPMIDKDQQTIR